MIVIQRRFSDVRVNDTETSPILENGAGSGGNTLPMLLQITNTNINKENENYVRESQSLSS